MEYNLTDSQKTTARGLVQYFLDHDIRGEVLIGKIGLGQEDPVSILIDGVDVPNFHFLDITQLDLNVLAEEKMITYRSSEGLEYISLREKIYTAFANDFSEENIARPLYAKAFNVNINFKAYRQILERSFTKEEIKTLCLDLEIEYDNLGSLDTLSSRIQELIHYCNRHGRLLELLITTVKTRPNSSWHELWD